MAFYQFTRQQYIISDLQSVWNFIATPANLKKITPKSMGFDIVSKNMPERMYEGMIIEYMVKPFPFYRTQWVTEITHIKEGEFFVDEQRIGPYRMWHHEHWLIQDSKGILMTDIVSYSPPLGVLGRIANAWLIHRRLERIFDYRERVLANYFSQPQLKT